MINKGLKMTILILFGFGGLQAQETISTTGGDASGSGGTSSYTVGQITYTTNTGLNGSVAQGVQQPYEISTPLGIDIENINLELSIYPNPTADYLTLKIDEIDFSNFSFQLFDLQGKLIESSMLISDKTTIQLETLPVSTYILKVNNNQSIVKIFKIVKN